MALTPTLTLWDSLSLFHNRTTWAMQRLRLCCRLAHSQDIRAVSSAKAVRGHTVENVCVSEDGYVTHELLRWRVAVWAVTPAADALILTLIGSCETFHFHPHCSYQHFLFLLPCPPLPFFACFPFLPVHIPLLPSSTSHCLIDCRSTPLGWSPS